MALELEGTIRQKLGEQSGSSARGAWVKQEFILEYPDGNFTAQVCLTAFGQEKVQELQKYQVGDRVKVSFNLRSREFNGRWYTDISIWRIAPAVAAAPAAPQAPANQPQAPAYQPAAPAYQPSQSTPQAPSFEAPAPSIDDMPGDSSDDLPF